LNHLSAEGKLFILYSFMSKPHLNRSFDLLVGAVRSSWPVDRQVAAEAIKLT
jgi:hypothetical protein